jgi:hypothetical protein
MTNLSAFNCRLPPLIGATAVSESLAPASPNGAGDLPFFVHDNCRSN